MTTAIITHKCGAFNENRKKKGAVPKCRACRDEVHEGELCLCVNGLNVPYEQNFVSETAFSFV